MSVKSPAQLWTPYWRVNAKARVRLFCLPYAGGGASTFRAWMTALSPEIDVCPIQLPGRENRMQEPAYRRLAPLVEDLAGALLPILDLPAAFFGHSMGALLSYEVARLLRLRYQIPVAALLVSGRPAPHIRPKERLHELSDRQLLLRLKSFKGTDEEVLGNRDLMDLFMPILRADFEVCETYQFEGPPGLSCPIHCFAGRQDPDLEPSELEAWRRHTSGPFRLKWFRGDHFYLNDSRKALLHAVGEALIRC